MNEVKEITIRNGQERNYMVTVSLYCTFSVSADSKTHAEEKATEMSNEKLLDHCFDFDVCAEESQA